MENEKPITQIISVELADIPELQAKKVETYQSSAEITSEHCLTELWKSLLRTIPNPVLHQKHTAVLLKIILPNDLKFGIENLDAILNEVFQEFGVQPTWGYATWNKSHGQLELICAKPKPQVN